MIILNAEQTRAWDQYTIRTQGITSLELMERASKKCVDWLLASEFSGKNFHIFCGKGNNGGDGVAIARLLSMEGRKVFVHILEFGHKGTDDFQSNLAALHQHPAIAISFIQSQEQFPLLDIESVIIDALYGTGLNRPLDGLSGELVEFLNGTQKNIVSIDMPSGLFADSSSIDNKIIHANHTLSFQTHKLAFLMAENAGFLGILHILDIGLAASFPASQSSNFELIDGQMISGIYRPRDSFGHKGDFGHALLIAGSYGKIGAAVLAAKACLRTGVGLLSCHLPSCGYVIMQSSLPEAMVMTDFNSSFITKLETDLSKYDCVGIGPGIGTATETRQLLRELLQNVKTALVIDADGLNSIALEKDLLQYLPAGTILTPHPKEFERLFGKSDNEFGRVALAMQKATELNLVIILKGHHTLVAIPGGKAFFNTTGNAGMATAGSGDTLTGIVTGLLAQGYSNEESALFGVYLHGLAGDFAAAQQSMEAMIAGDISDQLGNAFQSLKSR